MQRRSLTWGFMALLVLACGAAFAGHPVTSYLSPDVLAALGALGGGLPFMLGETRTIGEQITAFEATRQTKHTELSEIMSKASEEGRTLDKDEEDRYDTLKGEVESIDKHLGRLRDAEKLNLTKAKPVDGSSTDDAAGSRDPHRLPVQAKHSEKLEPGIEFARYAMCLLAAKGNTSEAARLAQGQYPQMERINRVLKMQADHRALGMEVLLKAAVEAGTTMDATFAAPLVDYQNFAGDFVEFLRPRTIIGQFGQGNVPGLSRVPFMVRIGGQTSGGNAAWVGEGAPKPLTGFDFNATTLAWAKVAAISVLTNELIRFSNPSAERLVRNALADAVIARIDTDFVDPAKAAGANVSPASITNGATAVASGGGTDADAIRADLQALWAPFIAARNPPRSAVYLMDSTTALAISLMRNPLGQTEFPGLTMNGGTFNGVPAIVSDYVPAGVVALVNANDIWLADDGQVTIDASTEASLQMADNPTNASVTATAAALVSMWQTNSTAFRAERYINWARRRASGVAYLTGVLWGTTPPAGP